MFEKNTSAIRFFLQRQPLPVMTQARGALDEFILARILESSELRDFLIRQAHLTRPATAGGATFTFIKNWHARRLSEPEFRQNEFWNPQPAP